jgi:DNA-binding XRE family transcriptional regulator
MSRSVTPAQIRAARALLSWSQNDLAKASRVSRQTIADFEVGKRESYDRTLADVIKALEDQGVMFIDADEKLGAGVRMRLRSVRFGSMKPQGMLT